MGARACRGISREDSRWHAKKIVWDCNEKKEMRLTDGEVVHKSWSEVEDCVSGFMGEIILTNLRLIWKVPQSDANSNDYHPNMSIGLKQVLSVQLNVNDSKYYGRCRTLSILTKWVDTEYEFSFAMPSDQVNESFHATDAWHKRFKSTRVFRETLVREMKMTKSSIGVVLYHPEKIHKEIAQVENIAAQKKYNGRLIITTHRFIWVSSRSAIVNVSIPFMEMQTITTRSSAFGLGLVVHATNISLSNKSCHLREGMKDTDDSILLGFKLPGASITNDVLAYCLEKKKQFSETPFYMPVDGKIIHRIGRWMVVDEETYRQEMGMNEESNDASESAGDENHFPLAHADSTELEFDDPLTPHANPVARFDLGGEAMLLDDLGLFTDEPIPEEQATIPSARLDAKSVDAASAAEPTNKMTPTSPTAAAYRVDPTCVICLTKTPQLAFDPCGHMCSCKNCGANLKECPMCRQPIDKTLKVFVVA
eukprot:GHVH01012302.1.p1 GENE.GHVH01012302.1~~GHVH01012302.1.p1  ORF type:complete len:508 (+),score=63.85 GHVH01012302.1:90-1526(+)